MCCKKDLLEEVNSLITVHEDYNCDLCRVFPIVGPRYHCNECPDFDLCEECYREYSHAHLMVRVDKCGKGRQL